MRYALVGHGRMGRAIEAAAQARSHACAAIVSASAPLPEAPAAVRERLAGAELAFEFTRPEAAERNVLALLAAGVPVVCGTTGWSPSPRLAEALAGSPAGLVLAPNFSLGVGLFCRIVTAAAGLLRGGAYHPWVLESHHRGKRDAPSGTALRLAGLVVEADPGLRGVGAAPDVEPDRVQIASLRAGAEPGTHVVGFDGEHDVITLRHAARGRAGFAAGAVAAAEWLAGRRGNHTFDEVIDDLLAGRR